MERPGSRALLALAVLNATLLAWALWSGSAEVRAGSAVVTNGYIVAAGIAVTLLVAWAIRWVHLPPRVLLHARVFALGSQALHSLGHLAGLYYRIPQYDNVLHFSLALWLALLSREALLAWRLAGRRPRPLSVGLAVATFGIAAAGVWELFEWGMDLALGTREQDDLDDTMLDMFLGSAGAVAAGLWAGAVQRSRRG